MCFLSLLPFPSLYQTQSRGRLSARCRYVLSGVRLLHRSEERSAGCVGVLENWHLSRAWLSAGCDQVPGGGASMPGLSMTGPLSSGCIPCFLGVCTREPRLYMACIGHALTENPACTIARFDAAASDHPFLLALSMRSDGWPTAVPTENETQRDRFSRTSSCLVD